MQSLQADRGILDYSAAVVAQAAWDNLDPLEFERYRRRIRESHGRGDASLVGLPDIEIAKALGAVDANGSVATVRLLGLLLFGREPAIQHHLPAHEVAFQVMEGTSVRVNDFFRWPLLRLFEEFEGRFRARNQETEVMVGMLRLGVPDYSEAAFREGLANALIHRDYTRVGAVHVQWHADRLEISNPGGFPEGVRLDNLLVTTPRPRNPLLADAFKRAGIVERTARGIDTIFYEQLRNGRPAPSYERSSATGVVLVLPGGEANLAFARLVSEEAQANRVLGLDDLLLLNGLWRDRRLTAEQAAPLLQKPEPETRARLQALVEAGLVESRSGRPVHFHLSASVYRRLGQEAAYVRQRGFDPLQQETMVLQLAQTRGRVTRRDVIGLCRLSPAQSYRLLNRLTKDGKLRQHGIRRAARYEPVQ
jgi:ATP-dependent DNA helicase RecG